MSKEKETPRGLRRCHWCKRTECDTLAKDENRYRHKFYCCQCFNARGERAFGAGKILFCRTCIPKPFVCTTCKRTDCGLLTWDYFNCKPTGMECCQCFDDEQRGRLDYEAMCFRCQELERYDSEGEESSESTSSREEEEEEEEETGDRDASPTRKKNKKTKDPNACKVMDELGNSCEVDNEGRVPQADEACASCLKPGGKRAHCACCSSECCQLCHWHYSTRKNHGSKLQNDDVICQKCYLECDSENGETWHKEEQDSYSGGQDEESPEE